MKTVEKIVSAIYGIMGWLTWLGVIALLVFMTVLFATGYTRPATVHAGEVTVREVSADEKNLSDAGIKCEGKMYRADFDVHIDGAVLSPYSYSARGVRLNDAVDGVKLVCFSGDGVKDGEVRYSKISPADFTVSVYVENEDIDANRLAEEVKNAGFRLTDMQIHFSLFDVDIA